LAFLFDTDAISELLRRRPAKAFVNWLSSIPREDQYTSAIVVGELFKGAFRSSDAERHLHNIEQRILPAVTVLPYDVGVAREFGRLRARLEETRSLLPDADIQIAATSIYHHLTLVTGNLRHFERFEGLDVSTVLADARDRL
jgi:predicted nucleic acid-binding protein